MDLGRVIEDLVLVAIAVALFGFISARRRQPNRPSSQVITVPRDPTSTVPPEAQRPLTMQLTAVPPDRLPTFDDVGGLEPLKAELRNTVGLLIQHADAAQEYGIDWNGVLLHGPPGVGKTFLAKAVAGEFGLSLVVVDVADLVTDRVGAGPQLVEEAFAFAAAHHPALLLFDEFDAVATSRQSDEPTHGREVLAQLLGRVEDARLDHGLLVVAATNDLDALDPAVVRPGRFDRHVRLDLPDVAARRAIFHAALAGRPLAKDIDYDDLADRTRGRTPAALRAAVDVAALTAFRKAAGTGKTVRITGADLVDALTHGGGEDRPMVEHWSWERLVLPAATKAELRELQLMIEDPSRCDDFGVDPPTGLLLAGPPGTGKTTVAKILAAEAACSFYPVSGADVTSRWVGESERAIARLFRRARANAPSIVFIDEIDAIGAARGKLQAYDRQLDQLLAEIDGMGEQGGIFVIGATNRPDRLDPALLRGGRLSRTIEIPLPDADGRRAILALQTRAMPLVDVDLDELALQTEGFSGADLKALTQQAAVEAMIRTDDHDHPSITVGDFARAIDAEIGNHNGHGHPPRDKPLRGR